MEFNLEETGFNFYLFHASSAGKLLTEPKKKTDLLSQTTISYLKEIWRKEVWDRREEIQNKYLEKGILTENEAIRMYGFYRDCVGVRKNETFLKNELVCGTPDIILKDKVTDIKNSWSLKTYMDAEVTDLYETQLNVYMWLLGLKKAELAYCLIDAPEHIIRAEISSYLYYNKLKLEVESDEYKEIDAKIRKNMTFGDIPEDKRIKIFEVEYNQDIIDRLTNKINLSREYLNSIQL
jgi:hypothetical protein